MSIDLEAINAERERIKGDYLQDPATGRRAAPRGCTTSR